VRLPLASLTVAAFDAERLEPFRDLIMDEVNVRSLSLTTDVHATGQWELALVPAVLGPRVGADVQKLIQAVKAGTWERAEDGTVTVLDRRLADDEFTLRLVPADESVSRSLGGNGGVVALDVTSNPSLEAEGTARDVIRLVQQSRKRADLHVSDRITLEIAASPDVLPALEEHRDRIAEAVLATDLLLVASPSADSWDYQESLDLDEAAVTIGLRRAG
jgi:isoleucyl-tRNA synthetase